MTTYVLKYVSLVFIFAMPIFGLVPCPKGIKQFSAYPDTDISDPSYFYDCSSTTKKFAELKQCPKNNIFDSKTEKCLLTKPRSKKEVVRKRLKRSGAVKDEISDLEELKREPTLGRTVQLGSLYYGKEDRVSVNENLWKAENLKENATILKKPSSKTQLAITQTTKEKVRLFGMGLSLRVSVIFGIMLADHSTKFLSEKRTKSNSASVSFSYEAITSTESISQDLRSRLDFPSICLDIIGRDDGPTHVVTSITRLLLNVVTFKMFC